MNFSLYNLLNQVPNSFLDIFTQTRNVIDIPNGDHLQTLPKAHVKPYSNNI